MRKGRYRHLFPRLGVRVLAGAVLHLGKELGELSLRSCLSRPPPFPSKERHTRESSERRWQTVPYMILGTWDMLSHGQI